ncbi:unnamed protein product, partial [Brassica oleracea var. botrytis]
LRLFASPSVLSKSKLHGEEENQDLTIFLCGSTNLQLLKFICEFNENQQPLG